MFRSLTIGTVISGSLILLSGGLVLAMGFKVNTTASIPVGVYQVVDSPLQTGAYVLFCPPQTAVFQDAKERGWIGPGFCPGDMGYMMKKVLGVAGDRVMVMPEVVTVNGIPLEASASVAFDSTGQAISRYVQRQYVLAENELLLMSERNSRSFDARYFGPIDVDHIQAVITPVVLWQ